MLFSFHLVNFLAVMTVVSLFKSKRKIDLCLL